MQVQIRSTFGYGAHHGIKAMIYGGPASGKTHLLSTVPGCIILSAEQGLLTLAKYNLPYIQIDTYADLVNAHAWAMNSQEARQFGTIGIDSASDIAECILANEKKRNKDPRKAYGEVLDQTIGLIRDFRDVPGRNVVVLAKMEYQKDEGLGMMVYGPSFPGSKLGQAMPYYFDEVFQIARYVNPANQSEFRSLRTRPNNQFTAKDRSGKLAEFEPANLEYVFQKIIYS